MKKLIVTNIGLLFISIFTFGQFIQPDSIYIYDEYKEKDWYLVQKDVFSFNFNDNSLLNIPLPSFVDTLYHYDNSYSIFNTVCFSNTATESERLDFINNIINMDKFNILSLDITKNNEPYHHYNHIPTDDLIIITFNNPQISISEIEEFADNYNLNLVYSPSPNLPPEVSWSYVFQYIPVENYATTIDLSNVINEVELDLVDLASPNAFSVVIFTSNITDNNEQNNTTIKTIKEGHFLVETNDKSEKNIVLQNLEGKILINKTTYSKNIDIDINTQPKGIYLLRISNNYNYYFITKLVR